MSSVRMCDKCRNVFSELDEGWQTFTATQMEYDDDGNAIATSPIRQDLCPECATPLPNRKSKRQKTIDALEVANARLDELTAKIDAIPTT